MSRMISLTVVNAALVVTSLAVGLVLWELMLRFDAYIKYAVQANFTVHAHDKPYAQNDIVAPGNLYGIDAGGPFTLSIYDEQGVLKQQNFVSINNYGWLSKRDFTTEKSPDEFRIAVLGDSFAGTITNSRIWADTLQDLANADGVLLAAIGKKRISVLNFGQPGASFEYFYYPEAHIAYRFSPDLVIVNFITEDIFRLHQPADTVSADPRKDRPMAPGDPPVPRPMSSYLKYGDISVPVQCTSAPPFAKDCVALPMWWVAQGRIVSPDEMQRVKRAVAQEMIWQRIIFGRRLLLTEYFHRIAPSQIGAVDSIARSVKALEHIRRLHPRILLAHVPTFEYLRSGYMKDSLEQFEHAAAAVGFRTERMEQRMPTQQDLSRIIRWYNLPYDGHWSDLGADLYAAAMHRLLRDHLLPGKPELLEDAAVVYPK